MENNKKMFKRGLSLALALTMCTGMLQTTAFAEEATDSTEVTSEQKPVDMEVWNPDNYQAPDINGMTPEEAEAAMKAAWEASQKDDIGYYYVKVVDENGKTLSAEDLKPEGGYSGGNGVNNKAGDENWVFIGQGTVAPPERYPNPMDVQKGDIVDTFKKDELPEGSLLPEGYEAPEEGIQQEISNKAFMDFVGPDGNTPGFETGVINTYHDIGEYVYYNGKGAVSEKTYQIVSWDNLVAEYGANFNSNELVSKEQNSSFEEGDISVFRENSLTNTWHVNGTATATINPLVSFVIENWSSADQKHVDQTSNAGNPEKQYVLKSMMVDENGNAISDATQAKDDDGKAVIKDTTGLSGDENYELTWTTTEDNGKVTGYVGTYKEKTYTVQYTWDKEYTDLGKDAPEDKDLYGKVSDTGNVAKDYSDKTITLANGATYTFQGWTEKGFNEDGTKRIYVGSWVLTEAPKDPGDTKDPEDTDPTKDPEDTETPETPEPQPPQRIEIIIEEDDDDDDDEPAPVVIPEEDVPLAETPDVEIPEEEVPLAEEPTVELPDEDVPLAEEPDVEIPDEDVPLADVPQTGDCFLLEAIAVLAISVSALWLALDKKRKA